ncbi:MAG: hypothetical protein LBR80_05385 [Deltaproteobacteria bacterium]|nr:hypothetical protein [Deltaproteobacteria bacterium]
MPRRVEALASGGRTPWCLAGSKPWPLAVGTPDALAGGSPGLWRPETLVHCRVEALAPADRKLGCHGRRKHWHPYWAYGGFLVDVWRLRASPDDAPAA